MNTSKSNPVCEADRIIERAKQAATQHSPNRDSQYAYLSGYLMSELRLAYITIENARTELRALQQELNSIGEI
jgi:hypothetical protein